MNRTHAARVLEPSNVADLGYGYPKAALSSVLESLPVPAELFAHDGKSLFVNSAFVEYFQIPASAIVEHFNVLDDYYIQDRLGLGAEVRAAFNGETCYIQRVQAPLGEIDRRFRGSPNSRTEKRVYQDIVCIPILDVPGNVIFLVILFIDRRTFQNRSPSIIAEEYIDEHWLEDFDLELVAFHAGLSPRHLNEVFRRDIGMTPYAYYCHLKIEKIKEALRESDLPITQVFQSCGADYSGGFAARFKRVVGMTPSQYRRASRNVQQPQGTAVSKGPDPDPDPDPDATLFDLLERFHVPIQVFSATGVLEFVNQELLLAWRIPSAEEAIGNYNLLSDPAANGAYGLRDYVRRSFKGEPNFVRDLRLPLEDYWELFGRSEGAEGPVALYNDILNLPLRDSSGAMTHLLSIFRASRDYEGRAEVVRARELIDNHWREPYDGAALARAVGLSQSQLSRVFRECVGMTPQAYYHQALVEGLKEALWDPNLSIAQAFAGCGIRNAGNASRVFTSVVGKTPSEHRRDLDAVDSSNPTT